jgi:antirestriction protein ArdC
MRSNGNMDVYEIVRDRILSQLDKGTVPWRKPWSVERPMNAVSKRPYSGINLFLLPREYGDNRWVTFKQADQLGGKVRKGEHGSIIVFWKQVPLKDEETDGKKKTVPILRYYTVFNVEQCEGLKLTAREPVEAIADGDAIIDGMPNRPPIAHDGGDRAFYIPALDEVHLPAKASFEDSGAYYATAFHELTHATGHATRLNRHADQKNFAFGCEDYAGEELVAEFGSAFLLAQAGIDGETEQTAAYIASWRKAIEGADKKLLVQAASKASKAAAYILGEGEEECATTTSTAEPVAAS